MGKGIQLKDKGKAMPEWMTRAKRVERELTDYLEQSHPVPDEVSDLLEPLPKRLRIVVILRQGFDIDIRQRSLESVARYFGLTRERIRQLHNEALNKLSIVHPREENVILKLPVYACKCGKYKGLRCKGIVCDLCGKKVINRGNKSFNLWQGGGSDKGL